MTITQSSQQWNYKCETSNMNNSSTKLQRDLVTWSVWYNSTPLNKHYPNTTLFFSRPTAAATQSSLCTPPRLNSTINTDNQISRALSGAAACGLQSHLKFLLLYSSWRASTWEGKASSGSYQSTSWLCAGQTKASHRPRRWSGNDVSVRWNFKQT